MDPHNSESEHAEVLQGKEAGTGNATAEPVEALPDFDERNAETTGADSSLHGDAVKEKEGTSSMYVADPARFLLSSDRNPAGKVRKCDSPAENEQHANKPIQDPATANKPIQDPATALDSETRFSVEDQGKDVASQERGQEKGQEKKSARRDDFRKMELRGDTKPRRTVLSTPKRRKPSIMDKSPIVQSVSKARFEASQGKVADWWVTEEGYEGGHVESSKITADKHPATPKVRNALDDEDEGLSTTAAVDNANSVEAASDKSYDSGLAEKKSTDDDGESDEPKVSRLPHFADKETLDLIREYLVKTYGSGCAAKTVHADSATVCDDDEMVAFMALMHRQAEQQTNFVMHHRMAKSSLAADQPQNDSDEEDEDTSRLVEEFVQIHEEQTLGRELFHKMIQTIQKTHGAEDKKKGSGVLDKRTIGWLRKSTGFHNSSDATTANHHHPAIRIMVEDDGRRFTRGMARQHQDKRQQKRKLQPGGLAGLEALLEAVTDLEQKSGVPLARPKKKSKASKQVPSIEQIIRDEDGRTLAGRPDAPTRTKRHLRNEDPAARTKKQSQSGENLPLRSKRQSPPGDPPRLRKRKKTETQVKQARSEKRSAAATSKGPVSLRLQDWKLRDSERSNLHKYPEDIYCPDKHPQPDSLPKRHTDIGLVLRDASWRAENPRKTLPLKEQPQAASASRRQLHGTFCSILMKHLSGNARSRSRYEFFYGDLDKGWYNRNIFVREAARLGVPPGSRLTTVEWKVVRSLITKGKPRRFSKAFLDEQRRDRDRYRRTVRQIQNSSGRTNLDLDWEDPVPARIPVGAIVTAFNSKYRILQRGVVLSYETARSKYFIRFPPGYGNLFCPDNEVARHGLPEFVIPGRTTILGDATRRMVGGRHSSALTLGDVGHGTSVQNLSRLIPKGSWGIDNVASMDITENVDLRAGRRANSNLVNDVAEREMVAVILGTIESALRRKKKIVECLEVIESAPQEQKEEVPGDSVAWLLANLDACNVVLERGVEQMRRLYGGRYRKHEPENASQEEFLSWLLSASGDAQVGRKQGEDAGDGSTTSRRPTYDPTQASLDDWSKRLILDSEDICRKFLVKLDEAADAEEDTDSFRFDRVSMIGSLLLGSSFLEQNINTFFHVHGLQGMYFVHALMLDRIAQEATKSAAEMEHQPHSPSITATSEALNHFSQVASEQQQALDELRKAVNALNAEVTTAALLECVSS